MSKFSTHFIRKFSTSLSTKNKNERVVVTGLGIVCPLGTGVHYVWEKLINCETSTAAITDPAYDTIPCKVAGFVPKGDGEGEINLSKEFRSSDFKAFSLATAYGLIAAKEALTDAKWFPVSDEEREATGVAIGTGMVDLIDIVNTGNNLKEKGYSKVSPHFVPRILANMTAGHVSIRYGFRGPNHAVSTACTTGVHAVGDAFNFIRNNYASVMVCGGTEAVISPLSMAGFSRMRALSTKFNSCPEKASRPFDKMRDGFVMGEGAGILVLESLQHALKRNAKIYAEILGYGLSGDAHHITAPSADGRGAYLCMNASLKSSGLLPKDITYINAHATSTPIGDSIELKAIHDVFGMNNKNLIISSTKGATGHLLGAAGSVEAVFTVLACHTGKIPPTANLENVDCNLNLNILSEKYVSWHSDNSKRRIGMTNSFGFGGTNATLIFSSVSL